MIMCGTVLPSVNQQTTGVLIQKMVILGDYNLTYQHGRASVELVYPQTHQGKNKFIEQNCYGKIEVFNHGTVSRK